MHRLTIQRVSLLKNIGPMCKSFNGKGFTRTSGVFFPLFRPALLSLSFIMHFVDILFYIIIVCDLVLVILQSVLSAFHILLTICFSHCKSTHHALCTAVGFSQSRAIIAVSAGRELRAKKSQILPLMDKTREIWSNELVSFIYKCVYSGC